MDDSNAATIELTPEEARAVVNALANYQLEASGDDERRALEVRDLLEREFDLADEQFAADSSFFDEFLETFDLDDGDRSHEIELTRGEAAEVDRALADFDTEAAATEAATVADLRERFAETFDLGDDTR